MQLMRPDLSVLSAVVPLVEVVEGAEAFDNDVDFDGPSGGTFDSLASAPISDTQILTDAADLALFTGPGTVTFPAEATGASIGSGAGNLILLFNTNAAATVTVTYVFISSGIDIEKSTNGEDADTPTGPTITVGDPVNWEYVVTNTGEATLTGVTVSDNIEGVAVTCPDGADTLASGASVACTATGVAALGQYANIGSVVGQPVDGGGVPAGSPVTDDDPSHYIGDEPVVCPPEKEKKKRPRPWPPGTELVEVGGVEYLIVWKGIKRFAWIEGDLIPVIKDQGPMFIEIDGVQYFVKKIPPPTLKSLASQSKHAKNKHAKKGKDGKLGNGDLPAGCPDTKKDDGKKADKSKDSSKSKDSKGGAGDAKKANAGPKASLQVLESCAGSTRFWLRGAGKHADTWNTVGRYGKKTRFFANELTYWQVLRKGSKRPYFKLAKAYIASRMNELVGSTLAPELERSMAFAERHFALHRAGFTNVKRALRAERTGTSNGTVRKIKRLRGKMLRHATILHGHGGMPRCTV